MPRRAKGLTAKAIGTAKVGRHGDGGGLYLLVREGKPRKRAPDPSAPPAISRFWIFRYVRNKKMREMGLGPAGSGRGEVGLAAARDEAARLMGLVRAGIDPLSQRAAEAAEAAAGAQAAVVRGKTFHNVADQFLAAQEAGWRNAKHRAQWSATLETYAFPHMGDLPVSDVETSHVMAALEPIWASKPETASRLRGRIEAVLDYAKAREWRSGENPARWRGHVENILPARSKVARVKHHPALPWAAMATFMADLGNESGNSAMALQFAILTAARSGEVLGAQWSEMDMVSAVWNVPAERMKAAKPHRVPLSSAAMAILRAMAAQRQDFQEGGAYVFPGARPRRPLSGMAMLMLLRRMKRGDLTAHGFRSTFRDWCAESTSFAGEVAEAALAHTVRDKVEAAYRRGDQFEKRRRLMEEWSTFCRRSTISGVVIPIGGPDDARVASA